LLCRTKKLCPVQLLLVHTELESTVRYVDYDTPIESLEWARPPRKMQT
jgi:hypothetical protein